MGAAGHPADDPRHTRGFISRDVRQRVAEDAAIDEDLAAFRQSRAVRFFTHTGADQRFSNQRGRWRIRLATGYHEAGESKKDDEELHVRMKIRKWFAVENRVHRRPA